MHFLEKKQTMQKLLVLFFSLTGIFLVGCKKNNSQPARVFYSPDQFCMGADLSYTNQIIDHGGIYKDSGKICDPYFIFKKYGTNVVRFRLFHHPMWTKEIYGKAGTRMYNDFLDVKEGIQRVKQLGMQVCLDFHYSDTWADPGKQGVPEAWQNLDLTTLHDSLYQYTYQTLKKLDKAGLMPEYVQAGNEINSGFLLPTGDRWHHTENFIYLINASIQAIRNAGKESSIQPKIIIHIAQPENVARWFEGLSEKGLTDYDIIGFSYYYLWSSVPLANISNYIREIQNKYNKDVMIMETAYPWTTQNADNYKNIIRINKLDPNYPANRQGQYKYLTSLTQKVIDGGGRGIFYWEPEWITSQIKTQWGQGSAWDCNTFFDFGGNVIKSMYYMTEIYTFHK